MKRVSGIRPARGVGMVLPLGVGVLQTGERAPNWRECQGFEPACGPGMVRILGVEVLQTGERAPKWRECQGFDSACGPGIGAPSSRPPQGTQLTLARLRKAPGPSGAFSRTGGRLPAEVPGGAGGIPDGLQASTRRAAIPQNII